MESTVHRAPSRDAASERTAAAIRGMAKPSRKLTLRALTVEETRPVSRKPGLVPAGIARQLPEDALAEGEWSISPEGNRVWRLAIQSSGAESVRVNFNDFHAGTGMVWVHGTSGDGAEVTSGPYTGDGPFGDGQFWSDVVSGDSITIAYQPAPDDSSVSIPFAVSEVSHRFRKGSAQAGEGASNSAAATCSVDVSCHPEFAEPASAVALMIFESGGKSYECSGALIGSASQPALPFFATANHCISTAAEARSLVSIFNYQTTKCGGDKPSLSRSPRVNGATLVSTYPMSQGDFTLLRLSAFPDVDVKVLGWNAAQIASNENVVGISHPHGDYKRIALGRRTRDVTIRFDGGERMPASMGYQVAWFEGLTQNGSSGSPLLVNVGGRQYFAGTLTAGPDIDEDDAKAACLSDNLVATYGRFSAVYAGISNYLTSRDGAATSAIASFAASPSTLSLPAGQTAGTTTITWTAPSGVRYVQVRVGSPTGPALTGIEGPTGSAQTGNWVTDGMTFYLQDASNGDSLGSFRTIAGVRVQVMTASTGARSGALYATPNPITVADGASAGRATLSWEASGVTRVQIRVDSPNGPAMTGFEAPRGAASTGDWVTDGMTFYLQDATDGSSSGTARTLAVLRAGVSR